MHEALPAMMELVCPTSSRSLSQHRRGDWHGFARDGVGSDLGNCYNDVALSCKSIVVSNIDLQVLAVFIRNQPMEAVVAPGCNCIVVSAVIMTLLPFAIVS